MKVTVELTLTLDHVKVIRKLIHDRVEVLKPYSGSVADKELEALDDIITAFEAAEFNISS